MLTQINRFNVLALNYFNNYYNLIQSTRNNTIKIENRMLQIRNIWSFWNILSELASEYIIEKRSYRCTLNLRVISHRCTFNYRIASKLINLVRSYCFIGYKYSEVSFQLITVCFMLCLVPPRSHVGEIWSLTMQKWGDVVLCQWGNYPP